MQIIYLTGNSSPIANNRVSLAAQDFETVLTCAVIEGLLVIAFAVRATSIVSARKNSDTCSHHWRTERRGGLLFVEGFTIHREQHEPRHIERDEDRDRG